MTAASGNRPKGAGRMCIECTHIDLRAAGGYAKLGMSKCNVTTLAPATFMTAIYAHECASFEPAPAETVAKRVEFLANDKAAKRK